MASTGKRGTAKLIKPPARSLASAESFVASGASKRLGVETSKRSIVPRKDGRTLRRTTIYFPADVATDLKVLCAKLDQGISDVVTEAVKRMLRAP